MSHILLCLEGSASQRHLEMELKGVFVLVGHIPSCRKFEKFLKNAWNSNISCIQEILSLIPSSHQFGGLLNLYTSFSLIKQLDIR